MTASLLLSYTNNHICIIPVYVYILAIGVCRHYCVAESKQPKELMNVCIRIRDLLQQPLVVELKQWLRVRISGEINSRCPLQTATNVSRVVKLATTSTERVMHRSLQFVNDY